MTPSKWFRAPRARSSSPIPPVGAALLLALSPLGALAEPAVPAGAPDAVAVDGPIVLPAPKSFEAAVKLVEDAVGVKGGTIDSDAAPIAFAEGRAFAVDPRVAERLLTGSHSTFRKAGVFLFRYERSFGLEGEKDMVGLLATGDQRAVIRRMGTAGPKRGVTNAQVVSWLSALEREEAFELFEIGPDYVAGKFLRAPKHPEAIARRAAKIAPDLVAGHTNPIAGLTDLIGKHRTLYLIWD
ncbi:DUF4253 domain-containing protein [Anaeromyxobacter sp. Fw109-5]|uniref:DUF4253 domain-containing protein n=1 Tax=Anaeromyxobacter sp. (strain Fw109-5) TaxID=404589 RepID=UPI0000ED71AD|nr:DUF4253 domain-containing protein [Anaeromyxobacter sp. Fw109-5]ABS27685.1 hypothetical protein Anae109_3502 [Anaeromyxobacter sp. Fw109-5]